MRFGGADRRTTGVRHLTLVALERDGQDRDPKPKRTAGLRTACVGVNGRQACLFARRVLERDAEAATGGRQHGASDHSRLIEEIIAGLDTDRGVRPAERGTTERVEHLRGRGTDLAQRIVQDSRGLTPELGDHILRAERAAAIREDHPVHLAFLQALSAGIAASDEALVTGVLDEVTVAVIVQRNIADEACRQPHFQKVHLAVAPPNTSTPGASSDAANRRAESRVDDRVVHRRLVGLVPSPNVIVVVLALRFTIVVPSGIELTAIWLRDPPREGRHCDKRARGHGSGPSVIGAADLHGR
mmetsp:Transcript_94235/g.305000  ORF Transcript_94235/g.305000 Transcript_94235/m.305000 type:complete len:300 (+) Transcript_94235:556-1455(+)